ncbi:TlpA family protein disulfide reductase [Maribacter sp. HTCC2170]|uniref:TlpA family protein disulfide reductase n=1 Tax=Maribacter sp. (strain HTCC2170 / KCCM 42371) TaxID=313603 RepID=UPI00006B21FE|nr:TlpA disulfide reductase family protein [Maribacter sp. HTCC2170]EAR00370.1 phenylalanyl-tRNA synthetase beta subunit [Maribacter sp. HTCC2170]
MLKYGLLGAILFLFFSCGKPKDVTLKEGIWLAELAVQDNEVLPFNFELKKSDEGHMFAEVFNAEEVIKVEEITINNDSIVIRTPVFEGYIAGKFTETTITGDFIKESLDRVVPFKATYGEKERFTTKQEPKANISGIWETEFSANTEDSYAAKGIFMQTGSKVTGTFRTNTGDYRYLDGVIDGDTMRISAFDGAHAFLFKAKVTDSSLVGTFYSGNHFQEPFVAKRNEGFELPSSDSLTFLKPGFDKFTFSFSDSSGSVVSLNDNRFKNKVVIVQVMGTWCPNCLDETKFLVNYLEKSNSTNVEVVALAFEYAKTKEKAFKSINRLKAAIGVKYPILLAQYGTSNKSKAQEKLPMLNHVLSYPTTIFIDKKGDVRKIHTGFNGPATGEKYETFSKEFDDLVREMSEE